MIILQNAEISMSPGIIFNAVDWLVDLFDRKESHGAFPRMFSQFLMNQARAGSLWVSPQMYTNLAKQSLKILRDKRVYIFPLSCALIPILELLLDAS